VSDGAPNAFPRPSHGSSELESVSSNAVSHQSESALLRGTHSGKGTPTHPHSCHTCCWLLTPSAPISVRRNSLLALTTVEQDVAQRGAYLHQQVTKGEGGLSLLSHCSHTPCTARMGQTVDFKNCHHPCARCTVASCAVRIAITHTLLSHGHHSRSRTHAALQCPVVT